MIVKLAAPQKASRDEPRNHLTYLPTSIGLYAANNHPNNPFELEGRYRKEKPGVGRTETAVNDPLTC